MSICRSRQVHCSLVGNDVIINLDSNKVSLVIWSKPTRPTQQTFIYPSCLLYASNCEIVSSLFLVDDEFYGTLQQFYTIPLSFNYKYHALEAFHLEFF